MNCCVSLEEAKKTGITLDEFVCLAKCQGIAAELHRPPAVAIENTTTAYTEQLKHFRQTIVRVVSTDVLSTGVLVCSYNRKTLGQTGSGHFSPIGAYDPETDHVLILDVARFKYPPHWVLLETLFESMRTNDASTGQPRGYCVLQKSPQVPTLVEAPSIRSCSCLADFIMNITKVLEDHSERNKQNELVLKNSETLATVVPTLLDGSCCGLDSILALVQAKNNVHFTCASTEEEKVEGSQGTNEHVNSLRGRILTALKQSDVYISVMGYLEGKGYPVAMDSEGVDAVARLTLLMLAVAPAIKTLKGTALGNEVLMLRTQLYAIHEGVLGAATVPNTTNTSACCASGDASTKT